MIWEPFVLALVLGLIVSGGLYFAYMWPEAELEAADGSIESAADPAVIDAALPSPATAATPATPTPDAAKEST